MSLHAELSTPVLLSTLASPDLKFLVMKKSVCLSLPKGTLISLFFQMRKLELRRPVRPMPYRVGTKVYAKAQRHERSSMGREQVVSVTALSVMTGSSDFNLEDLIHSLREKLIKCGTQS